MSANAEKLEKALEAAYEKITKISSPEFTGIADKLIFLLNHYRADGNPVGLFEVAPEAVSFLTSNKEKYSKQISQKLIDDISKATETETPEAPAKKAAPKAKATVSDAAATATKAAPKAKKEAAPKKAAAPKAKK